MYDNGTVKGATLPHEENTETVGTTTLKQLAAAQAEFAEDQVRASEAIL
jgi:hypothetical protein